MEAELNPCQTETSKEKTENVVGECLDQESVAAEEAATTDNSKQESTEENINQCDCEEARSNEKKTNDEGNITSEENQTSSISTEKTEKHEEATACIQSAGADVVDDTKEEQPSTKSATDPGVTNEQKTNNEGNINSEENQNSSISTEKTEKHEEATACIQSAGADIVDDTKEEQPSTKSANDSGVTNNVAQADSTTKTDTKKASEKRRECSADLPRSTTMPKTYGRSSKKDIAEKFGGVATSGVRVKRSSSCGAGAVKNMLLEWCRAKTRNREGVDIQNFSSSWSDGLAFCALIVAFFPDAFDYDSLDPKNRRQNFHLAFSTAEKLADCPPLLDIEDMVRMKVPDSKCVYTYVQELYRSLVAKGLVKTKKA